MKITITIDTSNSAFEGAPGAEISRVLERTAKLFALRNHDAEIEELDTYPVRGLYGNTVGRITVEES